MDWLLASIDPSRPHEVGFAVSWHARLMVLAWVIIAPVAVIIARYFKVMPGQDWPRVLDNQLWWRSHWKGQALAALLTIIALGLILSVAQDTELHGRLGYAVIALMVLQVALGIFRGTKGGPTAPAADGSLHGDHYDMTPWRVMFEWTHKLAGYCAVGLAAVTVAYGLWEANAARWMWLVISLWYLGLFVICVVLQKQGRAMDTYQAIWGPDPKHPGNQRKPIGWGVHRGTHHQPGE